MQSGPALHVADSLGTTTNGTPTLTLRTGDPGAVPTAILVADAGAADAGAAGYASFPLAVAADQSFSVPGVPVGSYFLELDASTMTIPLCAPSQTPAPIRIANFFELTANTPDLAYVTSTAPARATDAGVARRGIRVAESQIHPQEEPVMSRSSSGRE